MADGLLPTHFLRHLHLMMHTMPSHRLAKSLHSPLSLGCGLPPHVPTTTVARHPPCQEPHILTPLDGGILVEEDLPDEAPQRQTHANGTIVGPTVAIAVAISVTQSVGSSGHYIVLDMDTNYSVEVHCGKGQSSLPLP